MAIHQYVCHLALNLILGLHSTFSDSYYVAYLFMSFHFPKQKAHTDYKAALKQTYWVFILQTILILLRLMGLIPLSDFSDTLDFSRVHPADSEMKLL